MQPDNELDLSGRTILLVEDEAIIAMEIEFALEDAGARICGPVATLADALENAKAGAFDAAILDINLEGEDVYPAARELERRGIPFIFHTGHGDRKALGDEFAGSPVCIKPVSSDRLLSVLAGIVD